MTRKRRLLFVCGALSLVTQRALAQATDTAKSAAPDSAMLAPALIDAGRKVFHGKGTCSGCHGDKLQGGPVAPALTGPSWRHINGTYAAIIAGWTTGCRGR
jgi:Cytochrome c.